MSTEAKKEKRDSIAECITLSNTAPTVRNLCNIICDAYQSTFVLISWYVGHNYWFIAGILHKDGDQRNYHDAGWYVREEPTLNNIPIQMDIQFETSDCVINRTGKVIWATAERTPRSSPHPTPHPTPLLSPQPTTFSPPPLSISISLTNSGTAGSSPTTPTPVEHLYFPPPRRSSIVMHSHGMIFRHCVEAFLEKLHLNDLLDRQRNKQELLLLNISHSIRTPLNGIMYSVAALNGSGSGSGNSNGDGDSALAVLNKSTITLANNIFDIIDLTKLELGKMVIKKEVINMLDTVEYAVTSAQHMARNDVKITYHITDAVPKFIYSDERRIKQILINILENAAQFTNEGTVDLLVDALADAHVTDYLDDDDKAMRYSLIFSIKDTGIGLTDEVKDVVLKPLDLLQNTTHSGLSLRISNMLAEALGGSMRIAYTSSAGTCIEFILTVCEETAPGQKPLHQKQVLVRHLDSDNMLSTLAGRPKASVKAAARVDSILSEFGAVQTKYDPLTDYSSKHFDMVLYVGVPDKLETYDAKKVVILSIPTVSKTTGNVADGKKCTPCDKKSAIPQSLLTGTHSWSLTPDMLDSLCEKKTWNIKPDDLRKVMERIESATIVADMAEPISSMRTITVANSAIYYVDSVEDFRKNLPTILTIEKVDYHIMVVEDEPLNRFVIERTLKHLGYTTVTMAENGDQALKNFKANPGQYDLMLVDIRMPRMDGFELTTAIHKLCVANGYREPKMVGVTAQTVDETALDPWFKEFIYKPFSIKTLDKKIMEARTS